MLPKSLEWQVPIYELLLGFWPKSPISRMLCIILKLSQSSASSPQGGWRRSSLQQKHGFSFSTIYFCCHNILHRGYGTENKTSAHVRGKDMICYSILLHIDTNFSHDDTIILLGISSYYCGEEKKGSAWAKCGDIISAVFISCSPSGVIVITGLEPLHTEGLAEDWQFLKWTSLCWP